MEGNRSFQEIYERFQPGVLRFLSRLVGEEEAEDVTQEVFLRVDRGLEGFRGESSIGTWIYRIARNAALDHLRSRPAWLDRARQLRTHGSDEDPEEACIFFQDAFVYRTKNREVIAHGYRQQAEGTHCGGHGSNQHAAVDPGASVFPPERLIWWGGGS